MVREFYGKRLFWASDASSMYAQIAIEKPKRCKASTSPVRAAQNIFENRKTGIECAGSRLVKMEN